MKRTWDNLPVIKEVYVVMAYRYCDLSGYSYIVGVYSDEDNAIMCAGIEVEFRGGKYGCVVYSTEMDEFYNDNYKREFCTW